MQSRVFTLGDPTPTWVDAPPDVVVNKLVDVDEADVPFARFDGVATGDAHAHPVYVRPSSVSMVLALTPAMVASCEED